MDLGGRHVKRARRKPFAMIRRVIGAHLIEVSYAMDDGSYWRESVHDDRNFPDQSFPDVDFGGGGE